jgi:DNA-binding response OmpR family regulator
MRGLVLVIHAQAKTFLEAIRQIRALDAGVTILASGLGDEVSSVEALAAGADDYLPEGIPQADLWARLELHLRKAAAVGPAAQRFGDVEVDLAARLVTVAGAPVGLGPTEFRLVEYLCGNVGVAVSREQIMSEVYGYAAKISTERVDVLVRRVRNKLGEGPARGGQLVAVPGFGYRWERRRREEPAAPG